MPHLIFWEFCGTPCLWWIHYTGLFCIEISKHFFYNGQLDNALMDVKQIAKANMKNYLLDGLCSTQWGKNQPEVTSKSLAKWPFYLHYFLKSNFIQDWKFIVKSVYIHRGMNTRGKNWLLWKGPTVCCLICNLCDNFWTNYDLDLFSTSKWLAELQFCER